MAFGIESSDSMFSAEQTPFHGLGVVTADALDLDAALVTAGLDWTVGKYAALTRMGDLSYQDALRQLIPAHLANPTASLAELLVSIGFDLPIDGAYATVREDIRRPLATVGNDYTVWQNWQNFELAKVLMAGGEIKAETAGSLRDSRTVWLLCRLDRDMIIGGDEHILYLLFVSSHDGSSKVRVVPTSVRVRCWNTLRMALSTAKSQWTTSHTSGMERRVAEARETLQLTWRYVDEFEAEVIRLQDQVVTDLEFERLVFDLVPDPEPNKDGKIPERAKHFATDRRATLRKAWERSPEIGEFRGTGWGAVQAFSTVDLWTGRVHGGEGNRLERQALRVLSGDTMANDAKVRSAVAALAG